MAKKDPWQNSRIKRVLELLSDPEWGDRYGVPNWTRDAYPAKRPDKETGRNKRVSIEQGQTYYFGTQQALEVVCGINNSTLSILASATMEAGKRPTLPQPSFFYSLAEVLLVLDNLGTPLTDPLTKEVYVWKGFECTHQGRKVKVEPYQELWMEYMNLIPEPEEIFLSNYLQCYHDRPEGTELAAVLDREMEARGVDSVEDLAAALLPNGKENKHYTGLLSILKRALAGEAISAKNSETAALSYLALGVPDFEGDFTLIEAMSTPKPRVLMTR